RCPGSGMKMVPRTYRVRQIEETDRVDSEWRAERAEARGDLEEAQIIRSALKRWESEQGQEREELIFPVCESRWLSSTARGTSRPHRRWGQHEPSWNRVRQLRADIQTLQAELDKELEALEDQANPD
ncbi:MAG TPA: hypothetical protein VMV09_03410, partial [Candidatus Saccharimonadales bacterium]|nr:hypothetical protein [Candidatus Saccharimonadales bacterium]